jgi:Polyketide cyclase / dehydrase and lipid transport
MQAGSTWIPGSTSSSEGSVARRTAPTPARAGNLTACAPPATWWQDAGMTSEETASDETASEGTPKDEAPSDGKMSAEAPIERMEVQRTIPADAATIFRVLCDPQGHVAIDSSGMLMDATGEPVAGVGDSFVVHMDREALNDYPLGRYDVTVTITTFVSDREIAWTIRGRIRPQIGHIYGYKLEPVDDGTLVTSYYDWSSIDPVWKEAGVLPVLSEGALRATLGILDRTIARGGIGTPTQD